MVADYQGGEHPGRVTQLSSSAWRRGAGQSATGSHHARRRALPEAIELLDVQTRMATEV
jgi:hypothetical protein